MKLIQSIAPTLEPITLVEMKLFLRVLHADDDVLISSYIRAARERAETIMNRQLISATFELYFDVIQNWIILPRPPFVNIDSFQAYDGTAWNDISQYQIDDKAVPSVLSAISWPFVSSDVNSIKVVYRAGYADASKVPASIKAWLLLEVEKMYDEEKPRINVDSLLNSYRIISV